MELTRIELKGFKRFRFSHINMLEAKFTAPVQVITAPNGAGKYQPLTEPVKIPGGWKHMGDVKVGDIVTAWDGTPSQITGVFPQGLKEVYELQTVDGRHTIAGKEHLWGAFILVGGLLDYRTINTEDMKLFIEGGMSVYLPLWRGVEENEITLGKESLRIDDDLELVAKFLSRATASIHHFIGRSADEWWSDVIDSSRDTKSRVLLTLHENKSFDVIEENDLTRITSKYRYILQNIQRIMWSWGYVSTLSTDDNGLTTLVTEYTSWPSPDEEKYRWDGMIKVSTINLLPDKVECQCIAIDHPDKLYITRDYIVTHNSSLLRELCPLPSTRTDYDKGGYRILDIDHEGNKYTLTSDFNNRTSPHSFIMNNEELNVSGTSGVQSELVINHFGITPAIRDLVYGKTKLCNSSPSDRKTLFLSTNPMDLSLILDTHKKTLSRIRFYKDNLQHLYARKIDLEGQMISDELLSKHLDTKDKYMRHSLAADKIITILEQHIARIESTHYDILTNNAIDIHSECMLPDTEVFEKKAREWAGVDKQNLYTKSPYSQLEILQATITESKDKVRKLVDEINEYSKYIEQSSARPISNVENEIRSLKTAMDKYEALPDIVIPKDMWESHYETLTKINNVLFVFRDIPGTLLSLEDIDALETKRDKYRFKLDQMNRDIKELHNRIAQCKVDKDDLMDRVRIPADCKFTDCGLAAMSRAKITKLHEEHIHLTERMAKLTADRVLIDTDLKIIEEQYTPYEQSRITARYHLLLNTLSNGYFKHIDDWSNTLMHRLRTQPLRIHAQLDDYLRRCKDAYAYQELKVKYDKLDLELKHMTSNEGNSVEFLKSIIADKEAELNKLITHVSHLEHKDRVFTLRCVLMRDYMEEVRKVEATIDALQYKEDRAAIVHSLTYWSKLLEVYKDASKQIQNELHEISVIVKHQETIRATYENEILASIEKYEQEKAIHMKIETALSPTTGLPHKSMIKYLNTMIHNVNSFISRIWNYKLSLQELDETKPIDYQFKVSVGTETIRDISNLSDGQQEVVNFAWVLTILLQLKMLDKVPLFADELGRTFDGYHRNRVFAFIGQMIDNGVISQMFLVNHFAVYTDGFRDSEVLCLSKEDAKTLPGTVNEHVTMVSL